MDHRAILVVLVPSSQCSQKPMNLVKALASLSRNYAQGLLRSWNTNRRAYFLAVLFRFEME
jgi:hypothetical protein